MIDFTDFGMDGLVWLGIAFCISQSAIFSGLNLAFFSLSRLQLDVEAKRGNTSAQKILALREDSNALLATILWGNVSINVLLTLLADSVLAGIYGFLFSTIAITFMGEIIPQAYFSRNALKVASALSPVIQFYKILLYAVAKPTGLALDSWLGKEGITYFRERELKALISAHIEADEAEVEHVEGVGALNFLTVDEVPVSDEGEAMDPASIIQLPCKLDLPILPEQGDTGFDEFVKTANKSGHKWVVLVDDRDTPRLVMDADGFLRSALLDETSIDPYAFCHRPLIITDLNTTLGKAMQELKQLQTSHEQTDEVIDLDVIVVWSGETRRVITGADILGRLLKGIGASLAPTPRMVPAPE
jgi:CBS domain containing-hemolysin-like protein